MIKVIIIDDEQRARILLKEMLIEYCDDIDIVTECDDLPTGVKAIRKHQPDLVFLDIEMPGHSGLEMLDFFDANEINFSIIFTTAYDQYAIQAFKLSAVDYLLKPIDPNELVTSVERYKKLLKKQKEDYLILKENLNQPHKIAVPTGNTIKFIELENILFLEASSSYTEIVFADNTKLMVSRTLKNFEEVLNRNTLFFRCHKSYIVNIQFISDYVKSDGGYIILKNKTKIPISPEKTGELLEMMTLIKR